MAGERRSGGLLICSDSRRCGARARAARVGLGVDRLYSARAAAGGRPQDLDEGAHPLKEDTVIPNPLGSRQRLTTAAGELTFYSLPALEQRGLSGFGRLPFSIKILLEALRRQVATPARHQDA